VKLRVAVAQLRARPLEEAEQALADAVAAVEEASRAKAQLVVLPEATYPAYHLRSLEVWRAAPLRPFWQLAAHVGQAARRAGIWVAMGVARPRPGRGENLAVLWDPAGRVRARAAKRYLWHFDRDTFAPGTTARAAPGPVPLGLMVCADARAPEVARHLVQDGAWLLVDPTALVAFGDPRALRSRQLDHLLAARARENGVGVAVANKVGTEDGMVRYVGQSLLLDAQGRTLAQAPPSEPAVVWADMEVEDPRPQRLEGWWFPPHARFSPARHVRGDVFAAVAAGSAAERWPARVSSLGAQILLAPSPPPATVTVPWAAWEGPDKVRGASGGESWRVRADDGPSRPQSRIVPLGPVRLGILLGKEVCAPEPARLLAFSGADVLAVFAQGLGEEGVWWASVRADENKIPVLVVPTGPQDRAAILGPDGGERSGSLPGEDFMAAAYLGLGETRQRWVVPGTRVQPLGL
jgi:predicted amidohydrolase